MIPYCNEFVKLIDNFGKTWKEEINDIFTRLIPFCHSRAIE